MTFVGHNSIARMAVRLFPPMILRFGLVAAPRSTVIQPGPIHSGVTDDPDATLEELLGSLVTC